MKLLFIGDSLIEYNDWQASLPEHRVVNAGVAGETVAGLLARLPRLLDLQPSPEAVVVMIGANNLLMEDYFFFEDYRTILETLATRLPAAAVLISGLPPFAAPWLADSAIPRLNTSLASLASRHSAGFIDLHAAFSEGCNPSTACFDPDGVHLSPLGYRIWTHCINEKITQQHSLPAEDRRAGAP